MTTGRERRAAEKRDYRQTEHYKRLRREWNEANKDKLKQQAKEYCRLYRLAKRLYPEGLSTVNKTAEEAAQEYLDLERKQRISTRARHTKELLRRDPEDARRRRREDVRMLLAKYKSKHGCADCGERDPRVLDFDHREHEDKEESISRMLKDNSLIEVLEEIKKCDIRCSNCHRKRTATQFQHYYDDQEAMEAFDHPLLACDTVDEMIALEMALALQSNPSTSVPVEALRDVYENETPAVAEARDLVRFSLSDDGEAPVSPQALAEFAVAFSACAYEKPVIHLSYT